MLLLVNSRENFDSALKTWKESKSECNKMNGTLASVTSIEIHNFLMKKVDKESRYSNTWFWIGGTDKDTEGSWKWVDGSDWDFAHWSSQALSNNKPYKKQSPDGGSNQNCLQLYHGKLAVNGWNDQYCTTNLPFICSWKICSAGKVKLRTLAVSCIIKK